MKYKLLVCSLCILFSLSGLALGDAIDEAQVFVLRYDSRSDDLLKLAKEYIDGSEGYQTIVNGIGEEKANKLIFSSFLEVQYPYRLQWERSLAESYLEVFSLYELDSIHREGKTSPYYSKFIETRKAIGESALLRSESTIKAVAAETLEKAISSFNSTK